MSVLIFALVVVIVVAMMVWAVSSIPVPSPLSWVIQAAVILIGALVILAKLGVI